MTKGRKAAPEAVRFAKGTASVPAPRGEPTMPTWPWAIAEHASAEWARLCDELRQLGSLSTADRGLLELASSSYGRATQAEERVDVEGPVLESDLGGAKANPWVMIADRNRKLYLRCLAELRLTPRSRPTAKTKPPEDKLDKYLEGTG